MGEDPREGYVAEIRELVGSRPILLPSVSVLVVDDGRLLFGRHRDSGLWVPPGGAMEPGETPAQTGVRETHEETGLEVRPTRLMGVFGGPDFRTHYPNGDIVDHVNVLLEAGVVGGQLATATAEFSELGWFTASEVDQLDSPIWVAIARDSPGGLQPFEEGAPS